MTKKLYLIDGSGFIFRAFHGLPPLKRHDGTPVGAVFGFTSMLLKVIEDHQPESILVVFDAARKTFRQDIYADYKAHRPPPPPELIPQFALCRQACEAFHIPRVELEGYEADDLIASYGEAAQEQGWEVVVVSSDKDLMQLVTPSLSLFDPLKNKPIRAEEVQEKFGVPPSQVIDVQALAGDSSDNIPGVPGVGPKTAAELIQTFGSLEKVLEEAHTIKQPKRREALLTHKEQAEISKILVTLKRDVPLPLPLEQLARAPLEEEKIRAFCEEQNFKTLLHRALKNHTPPKTYTLIQDEEVLKEWVKTSLQSPFVAIDTETNSLNARSAKLVGISLSCQKGQACYIPLGHVTEETLLSLAQTEKEQLPLDVVKDILRPLLTNPGLIKVGHNIKFDLTVLKAHGFEVCTIEDTMVLSYLLRGTQHSHSLDELSKIYLGHKTITYKEVAGKGTFDHVPLEKACTYAAEDADITGQLYALFKPQVFQEKLTTLYETIERPLIIVLRDMEYEGILVDTQYLRSLSTEFGSKLLTLEEEIFTLAGERFNLASPKQLGVVLFEKMNFQQGKKGKSGALSTAVNVLEDLALTGHPLPQKILEWRSLAKLKNTYTDSLPQQVDPLTGRIHTSYAMSMTSTGRLSSTDPNLQNIPVRTEDGRKIRRAFIAAPGSYLLSADYSQIELRLLAHFAHVPLLSQAFEEGQDIHALTASHVFQVPLSDVTPDLRRRAKTINFGIIYGISPFGLSQQLAISTGEASHLIKTYFSQYPGIEEYMEDMKKRAREQGYVTTLLGRRCFVPSINDPNFAKRAFAERQAINAPLQGSNADIIKKAMILLHKTLQGRAKMLLQVHDELVFETDDPEGIAPLIKETMENCVKLKVPLLVDLKKGPNWGEVKPF